MRDTVKALKICFSIQGILILIVFLGFMPASITFLLLPLNLFVNNIICTVIYWKPLKCELTEISPKYEQWFDHLTNITINFLVFALSSSVLDSDDIKRARLHVRLIYLLHFIIFIEMYIFLFAQIIWAIIRQT